MSALSISSADLTEAVEEVHAALAAKSLEDRSTFDFCKQWPIAKAVLEVLGKVPKLGWIVQLLIAVGDAYSKKHCPIGQGV